MRRLLRWYLLCLPSRWCSSLLFLHYHTYTNSDTLTKSSKSPCYTTHQNINLRAFLACWDTTCTLGYSFFTQQLHPSRLSPSSRAPILTLTGNHSIPNKGAFFHKTILSFFLSLRFSIQLWVRVWSTEGRAGLSGEPTSREIRYSFTRESAAHVLSRPLTYRLLYKSITMAQCPPLGLGTHSPLSIGSRSRVGRGHSSGSHGVTLNATSFCVTLWKKYCISAKKMFLALVGHYIYPQYTTWTPLTFL